MVYTGGYFLYDLLSMMYLGILDLDMLIHHLLCVIGMAAVIVSDGALGMVGKSLFVNEVSNPPMHFRVLLRMNGLRYSRAYEVAEWAYFIIFFVARMMLGHPIVYQVLTCSKMHFIGKIFGFGILAQSYLFLYRMYFIMRSRLKETAERNQKGIKI